MISIKQVTVVQHVACHGHIIGNGIYMFILLETEYMLVNTICYL